jgi:hypothetical protein
MESTITVLDCFNKDADGLSVVSDMTLSLTDGLGKTETIVGRFQMSTPVLTSKTYYVVYLPKNPLPLHFCYYVISTYKDLQKKMGVSDIRFETLPSTARLGIDEPQQDILTIYLEDNIKDLNFDLSTLQKLAEQNRVIVYLRTRHFEKSKKSVCSYMHS